MEIDALINDALEKSYVLHIKKKVNEMKDQILDFMERDDFKPMKAEDLIAAMKIKDEDLEEFFADLRQLEEDGLIIMNRKSRYGLCRHMNLLAGHMEGNPKGFGFFVSDQQPRADIYIPLTL